MPRTWDELEDEGWKKRIVVQNDRVRVSYMRPNGKLVQASRDLTAEEVTELKGVLFPPRGRRAATISPQPPEQGSQAGPSDSGGVSEERQPVRPASGGSPQEDVNNPQHESSQKVSV